MFSKIVDVVTILRSLEAHWEAGALPGKQSYEHNTALRELWRLVQQEPPAAHPARLRLVRA
jgi:hypothetical protein